MKIREYYTATSYFSKSKNKDILGKELRFEFTCDLCSVIHNRTAKHYKKMKGKFPEFDKDYCNKCWIPILNNRPERIEKMRKGLIRAYEDDPKLREKMSKIVTGRNAGDNNPMKRPDIREKVSKTRTALLKDQSYRDKFRIGSLNAWARGAYDNADKSGYSHWYPYLHSNGSTYNVQGRYELAFIKYLDDKNMAFECHKGKIPYIGDDGLLHHYFPDFFVYEWNCWVDPKAQYWYKKQIRKFELLKDQYTDHEIRILMEDELKSLGIKL